MTPISSILTETPRHNTTKFLHGNNIFKLPLDKLGRIPRPEQMRLRIPVILAAGFLIRLAFFLSATPRICYRNALAFAEVREAACLAEFVGCAAVLVY